jgi:hypothetical protein
LKLAFVTAVLRRSQPNIQVESHLIFADLAAASIVNSKSWSSLAAKEFEIATQVITLPHDVIDTIKEAQRRQDIRVIEEYEQDVRDDSPNQSLP